MHDPEIHDLSVPDFRHNAELNRDAIEAIHIGLTEFNQSAQPDPSASPLVLVINNAAGSIVAGVLGRSAYGWLRIDIVWVVDERRGKGYGTMLMSRAEEVAVERGCRGIHLDTHEFQAPAFYEQLGYEVFGKLENYPEGYDRLYFKKELRSSDA